MKRMSRQFTALLAVCGVPLLVLTLISQVEAQTGPKVAVQETYGKLPLSFEANRGQTDSEVKFLSRGRGYTLFLTPSEAVLALRQATKSQQALLRLRLNGGNPEAQITGLEKLPGVVNYFIGNEPTKWCTNIPIYSKVRHRNVYPGVDVVYYGNHRQLEFDFVVAPGTNPNVIRLEVEGADRLAVDVQGDLVLSMGDGHLRLQKPVVYQAEKGIRQEVSGSYVLTGTHQVGFQVTTYDTSRPLVIDPVLFYSTYLGGNDADNALSIAVDASGNAYVTGFTSSTNFPTTTGALQTTYGGSGDVFITKLNPTGSALVYSTYLGGSGGDEGRGIAVDAAGNAYVTGETFSADFPTTLGVFQTTYGGGGDVFITKLNPTGSALVYSTYLGGSGFDSSLGGIAVDVAGNAYVTGGTDSTDFPTTLGVFQPAFGGSRDAFVTKLNPTGSTLVYSTYLGGSGSDESGANSIAVDAAGNAYVTGETTSTDFPTTPGAFQPAHGGGFVDGFVTRVNPLGSGLVYSTYLGGSAFDSGNGIAVDATGNAYVTGFTDSANFPTTPGTFQPAFGGSRDAFVTKLNPTGSTLVYSTYLGGSGFDVGGGIALDALPNPNAYVTGFTDSTNFPTTPGAFQTTYGGGDSDAFVTKLNPTGTALVYSTYLGGSAEDDGNGIALDTLPNPNAYVTGDTLSTNFPTTPGAFQPAFGGGLEDAFVAKISQAMVPPGQAMERVTGGGTITVVGGIGTFSFIVQQATTGEVSGQLQYFNHASGAQVKSDTITSLMAAGNTATFNGTCTVNGAPCTFAVNVTDNGEPGTTDTFTISVSGGPTEGGTLRSGNILIHQ